ANRLYRQVKALLAEQPKCRFLVFDFRLVAGIDSSATHSFSQIKQAADECGATVVLVGLTPQLERAFRVGGLLSGDIALASDLDRALESCEEAVIAAHAAERDEKRSLHAWLSETLGGAEHAERLIERC